MSEATSSVLSMKEFGALSGRESLLELRASFEDQVAAEVRQVLLLSHLAELHRDLDEERVLAGIDGLADERRERQRAVRIGADGTAPVAEWLALEIGPLLGITPLAAGIMLADVLNLRDRHPRLWRAVLAGRVRVWQARTITRRVASAGLSQAAAKRVDAELVDSIDRLPWGRVLALLDGLIVDADPEQATEREAEARAHRSVRRAATVTDGVATIIARVGLGDALRFEAMVARIAQVLAEQGDAEGLDQRSAKAFGLMASPARALAVLQSAAHPTPGEPAPGPDGCPNPHLCGSIDVNPRRLLPRSTLVVHVSDDALRTGRGVARVPGVGPVPVERLRELLADSRVSVRPVFEPGRIAPVDSYEIPAAIRAAILLRDPYEAFPFSTRRSDGLDLDHTRPYDHRPGAPPGQTRTDNLGPLSRRPHRAKTHGNWRVAQRQSGVFEWTSPYGFTYLVGPFGTIAFERFFAAAMPTDAEAYDEVA